MLRTVEQREERQQALKRSQSQQLELWDEDFFTLNECAHMMKVSRATARRIFRHEPGVEVVRTPGSERPIIRVPRSVYERVLRRSAIPWER